MDKLKQWVALTVVGALGILAVGWFVLVSPKRGEATELRDQTAAQVSANALLQTRIEVLKAQAKELPKEQAALAAVGAKIPESPSLPSLVRALLDASKTADVELVSITPGPPAPVTPPAAAAPAVAADGTTPAAAPAPVPPTAGAAGQLANIPVAINVVGDYFKVTQFLAALETLPRALRVNDLSMAPGVSPADVGGDDKKSADDGSSLTTTINGFVFMAASTTPAPAGSASATSVSGAVAPITPAS